MPKEKSFEEMQSERQSVIAATVAGSVADSWPRVRQHLIESPSIYTDRHIHTIWEGPSRSYLLPLPFEVLREFTRRFGALALPFLSDALTDSEPLVVGYALHALSEIDSDHFTTHARSVFGRQDQLHTIFGSFGWEGTISEYATRLQSDL